MSMPRRPGLRAHHAPRRGERLSPTLALGLAAALTMPVVLSGCLAASTVRDSLMVSASATRTSAHPLPNTSVQGRIYVFVPASTGISQVTFNLDGGAGLISVDGSAPWDLAGTATSRAARPFDVSRLSPGLHRLVARIRRGQAVSEVTASFTVKSPAPTASPVPSSSSPTPSPAPTPTDTPTSTPSPIPDLTPSPTMNPFTATSGRPWSASSPFNTVLPVNAVLASNSDNVAGYLAGGTNQQIANLYDYGWPVFPADASTPRATVRVTQPWGSDPFGGQSVPIPAGFAANAGSDGHVAVVDYSTGRSYEFWQLKKVDTTHFTASWGQVTPDIFTGSGNEQLFGGSSTGSGMSGIAGLVRTFEMRAGVINHALAFASDAVTPGLYQFPATKTDGSNMAALPLGSTIPEGARIRLDPSIDLAAIPGITPAELIVGRALQTYGAFCMDQGGARMAFGFENPIGDPAGDPYPGLGLSWDYYAMKHLPWNKLQVLRQWDGK
jgi:hypothetical protein